MNPPPPDAGILCRFCGKRYPNEEITVRSDPEEMWIIEICEGCLKKKVQVEVVSVNTEP